jgi:putative flavoprotein involved in K+ transport
VLVVGSAQSGCQIAEDLLVAGRRVVLATSPAGRFAWRYRGGDTIDWLVQAGVFDQRPGDLPDPSVMRAAQPIVAAGGRSLSLPALASAGATLVGRPVAVAGERVSFDDSVQANIAAGDAFAARVRGMIDDLIRRRGLDAPPYEPDDTEGPWSWTRRRSWTCATTTSAAWCGAPGSPATSPSWTPAWSTPAGSPGTGTPPAARPASGTSG